ncbi:MAG: hypothetical protein QG626_619 [Patescibacteria group bacterium]|jgi:hypothetical protein|nr:hypothetical protein [Patescibacteria group bacterium]
MKCPECDYDMGIKATKVTRSSIGRTYNWTQFHCKRDDVWIELEVPKENED